VRLTERARRASSVSRPDTAYERSEDVITCCAVVGFASFTSDAAPGHRVGCDHVLCSCRAISVSRPYIFHERCSAVPPYRMWSPTVLLSALAEVPAALADLTYRTCDAAPGISSTSSDAAPCHRVGCAHAHVQTSARAKTSSSPAGLLRVAQHVAPLLSFRVTFHVPATPLCRALGPVASAGLTSFFERCEVMPSYRMGSPAVQLSAARAKKACSFSRPDILYERCEDTPSCRMCSPAVQLSAACSFSRPDFLYERCGDRPSRRM